MDESRNDNLRNIASETTRILDFVSGTCPNIDRIFQDMKDWCVNNIGGCSSVGVGIRGPDDAKLQQVLIWFSNVCS